MEEAEFLADNLALLDSGKLVCKGSPDEIKKKYGFGYNLILSTKHKFNENNKEDIEKNLKEFTRFV